MLLKTLILLNQDKLDDDNDQRIKKQLDLFDQLMKLEYNH